MSGSEAVAKKPEIVVEQPKTAAVPDEGGTRMHRLLNAAPRQSKKPIVPKWTGMLILCGFLVALPWLIGAIPMLPDNFPVATMPALVNNILIAGIGAAGFTVLLGTAGQVSVAQEAFLIVGTIAAAIVGPIMHASMFWALPAAFLAGLVVGGIAGLPALRLANVYLLVATIGLDFVAQFVFQWFQVRFVGLNGIQFSPPQVPVWLKWIPGLSHHGQPFMIDTETRWYWIILPISAITVYTLKNFSSGRYRRAFSAVSEKDNIAALLGVNVVRTKIIVFAVTAGFVSMAGCLAGYHTTYASTDSFDISLVLTYAIMIAVGGFGSVIGAFWGATFVLGVPFVLNWLFQNVAPFSNIPILSQYGSDIEQILFGVILIVLLIRKEAGKRRGRGGLFGRGLRSPAAGTLADSTAPVDAL